MLVGVDDAHEYARRVPGHYNRGRCSTSENEKPQHCRLSFYYLVGAGWAALQLLPPVVRCDIPDECGDHDPRAVHRESTADPGPRPIPVPADQLAQLSVNT